MKRALKVLFTIVFFAVFIYIFAGMAISGHVDFEHMNIYFGEVPEGAAFADILVKGRAEDREIDFNVSNGYFLKVDRNCEIAEYNADGYTSLFLKHRIDLEEYDLSPDSENKHMEVGGGQSTLSRFPYMKLAYCDKDGNILGITKEIKVKKTSLNDFTYEIKADGDELECKVLKGPKYYLLVLAILVLILLAVCAVVIIRTKNSQKAQYAKTMRPIHSGDADNESEKQD